MNEHKHGDAYKVEMLRRMLAHETNACEEHYGAWLSHHDVSIKHLTIDAGGIAALIRYYENHDTDLDGGVPEFELTEDELEAAYRKRVHHLYVMAGGFGFYVVGQCEYYLLYLGVFYAL